MTAIRTISKKHWQLDLYMKDKCPDLLMFLEGYFDMWGDLYRHAYKNEGVEDITTEDGLPVRMVPYNFWRSKFSPEAEMNGALFMLCSMGLLGVDEDDLCDRKEWIFYVVNRDYDLIKWYIRMINKAVKSIRDFDGILDWMEVNLKDGCTYHKMVCGSGGDYRITIGFPSKLAGVVRRQL